MKKAILKWVLMGLAGIGLIALGVVMLVNVFRGDTRQYDIVATNFAGYDAARAVVGDSSRIKMLVPPGADIHAYEPTPQDVIDIKNAKLFIYNGGESEEWVEELISDNNIRDEKTLRLMGLVDLHEEETTPEMETEDKDGDGHGHEHEHEHEHGDSEEVEYDEHIWTSPLNMVKLVSGVKDKLIEIFPEKAKQYEENATNYIARLTDLDLGLREVISSSPKRLLIFGDRFPFLYFVREYGLEYVAAFPGCSEQTEASAATVAELIRRAKEDEINVVLKIELTSNKIAQAIADEISGRVMELSAAHNISKTNFEAGMTYLDIWEDNLKVLKEALR